MAQGCVAKKSVSQPERAGFSAAGRKSEGENRAARSTLGEATASFCATDPSQNYRRGG
jgi:hypothetical protein